MTTERPATFRVRAGLLIATAVAGLGAGWLATAALTGATTSLPPVTLLWCEDFPGWVEAEAIHVPSEVASADRYGGHQRNWRLVDAKGYDDACRAAFERWVGDVPPRDTPMPDMPPDWHVAARGYVVPVDEHEARWLVVYGDEVWACDALSVDAQPMQSDFACRVDLDAPFPSPSS